MIKSFKSLWGRFLFQDRGILPTNRLLLVVTFISIILLLESLKPISWITVIIINCIALLISLIDLVLTPNKNQLEISRSIDQEMERGMSYDVSITVRNFSNQPLKYRFIDGIPQSFKKDFPITGNIRGNQTSVIQYDVIAPVRGNFEIDKVYFRYKSRLGLWEKQTTVGTNDAVRVIPDLTETKQYLENAQKYLMYEGSKIRKQQKGDGEFTKIRNYVVGDDPRKINWRQSAKLQELMTNEYEPEHGKYITILIDCGRMMGAELEKGNRLERALEASLTVAAAALQKGDYVSVLAFAKGVEVYVPPAKGMNHLKTILHAIYNVKVEPVESNYATVLNYVQTMQKKRSLLILFSDIHTFLHEESALVYLKRLRRRHLFIMIGLEDETLRKRVNDYPSNLSAAMVKTMAQQQLLNKQKEKIKWEKQGLQMVEAQEEKLAVTAVSHYISIMNRGLI